ncbi:hypothetical protein Pst134EA_011795 [Puccinia striiformis f. sp. tritici]|uniref:hypothetical protein n=1 Tax=Puccinia striiformis f. sp. tritici TaxID=168172 RepID=UPI002007C8A4|nr:hypothetical protein Pst134EA_011795 [Puccinia striiformis f. sp. tritici]KAH9468171.1 hypothetical protein Pst134EA_011795 [Puccinia striiformis f. sp. tritici]
MYLLDTSLSLVGLLWLFSRHYRSRTALRRKPPAAWFPDPHTASARDVYISLLSMDPPPSQAVLVAALLARAMTDVEADHVTKRSQTSDDEPITEGTSSR